VSQPVSIKWVIGFDRFGRRVTLTKEGDDIHIESEPMSQLDDGEKIRNLSVALIRAAAEALK
jgi:hypothetical protein